MEKEKEYTIDFNIDREMKNCWLTIRLNPTEYVKLKTIAFNKNTTITILVRSLLKNEFNI